MNGSCTYSGYIHKGGLSSVVHKNGCVQKSILQVNVETPDRQLPYHLDSSHTNTCVAYVTTPLTAHVLDHVTLTHLTLNSAAPHKDTLTPFHYHPLSHHVTSIATEVAAAVFVFVVVVVVVVVDVVVVGVYVVVVWVSDAAIVVVVVVVVVVAVAVVVRVTNPPTGTKDAIFELFPAVVVTSTDMYQNIFARLLLLLMLVLL